MIAQTADTLKTVEYASGLPSYTEVAQIAFWVKTSKLAMQMDIDKISAKNK